MKQLIEMFVTIFLVIMAVLLFSQFIGAELQINGAKNFHSEAVSQIESSNFKEDVIRRCKEQAQSNGYDLEVQNSISNKWICNACNTVFLEKNKCPTCKKLDFVSYAKDRTCKVVLKYKVNLKLINVNQEGVISGFAR